MLKTNGIWEAGSYNVLNLNTRVLQGLMKEPKKLQDLIVKTIKMYE